MMASRRKRNYVVKGVPIGIPRYSFDPRKGDKFYVSGKLITVTGVSGDMLAIRPHVDGMTDLSVGNLYQIARVPEDSRFAPYEYRVKKNLQPARIKKNGRTYTGYVRKKAGRVQIFVTPQTARKINPHAVVRGKRYRAILTSKPGTHLLGGKKRVVSSWFSSRKDASDYAHGMRQPNLQSVKIEAGQGVIDIGPGGSWVR